MNVVEIDLGALRKNYRYLQSRLSEHTEVLAVVKSDAYGHGMLPIATCLRNEGVRVFGVAEVAEGVLLRQAGITGKIIVFLGADKEGLTAVLEHDLQLVVFDADQLAEISSTSIKRGGQVAVHVKIDTGMGRLGILPEEAPEFIARVKNLPGVYLAGMMSHLPLADSGSEKPSLDQNRLFTEIFNTMIKPGEKRSAAHIANSAALFRFPDMHWDMVRPGISLYGCYPAEESLLDQAELSPVMSFKTKVIQVKEVGAGFGISYGHTFTTSRPSRLAVLPVGYNNGYLRALSNRAEVLVHGRRAPQRGRVCMNATVIDVTDIPDVRPGDEVVLMGCQGEDEIRAEEVARWMDTINYEVLCLFGNNNPRVFL